MSVLAPTLTIRQAEVSEYESVDLLIAAAYAHDYGPSDEGGDPMRASARRAAEFDVWVALDPDGRLLGSVTTRAAGGRALHEDVHDGELDLRLLGVAPGARRRGIAAALMTHVRAVAAEQGFAAVLLKTAPNMGGAHRLYEGLGFVRLPERDGLWIGGERVFDLYTYRLPLRAGD